MSESPAAEQPSQRGVNPQASDATIASDAADVASPSLRPGSSDETIASDVGSVPIGHGAGLGALGKIGPYVILQEVGRGAQGVVYRAVQTQTNRAIALKCMIAGQLASPRMRQRFAREVRTAASLNHPNIVTVYAVDEVDGRSMLAMEWIDGVPVDKWARGGGALGRRVSDMIALMIRICDAVHHAHQQGVIHRDLKPTNILVDEQGEPHLLDFGLAKLASPGADQAITMTEEFVGTPAYAAPEQFGGDVRAVDVRTDVYALGVMFFEMLTGALPYNLGRTIGEWIDAICHREPARPSSISPRLGREIDAIAFKALAKEKALRYPSVDAFATDLRRYLAGEPVLAHAPSSIYYLRKVILRHKLVSASTALLFISVTVFAYLSWAQAQRNAQLALEKSALADQENRARLDAERQAYFANIVAADANLRAGELQRARARLSNWQERASSQLKNFEWAFLTRWLDAADLDPKASGEARIETGAAIEGLAVLPVGVRVAVIGEKSLTIWNVVARVPEQQAQLSRPAAAVAIAADGARLLLGVENGVEVYNAEQLSSAPPVSRVAAVGALCAASGGGLFATGDALGNVVVAAIDSQLVHAEFRVGAAVSVLRFSADDRMIFAGDAAGTLEAWDISSAAATRRFAMTQHAGAVRGIACSLKGDMLATVGEDGALHVLDARTGEKLAGFDTAATGVTCAAFHPSGSRLASGGDDGAVTLWDVQSREEALVFSRSPKAAVALEFSPDGALLIAAGPDGSLRVWQATQTASEVVGLMFAGLESAGQVIESLEADVDMEPWFRRTALRLAREKSR